MNFGRVVAPYAGKYAPQWGRVRLPLIAGEIGIKRRGIEAIVRTWGGSGYARFQYWNYVGCF